MSWMHYASTKVKKSETTYFDKNSQLRTNQSVVHYSWS